MKYVLFDPKPYFNDYASRMFFHPMRAYARDTGKQMEEITNLDQAKNSTVIILTDHLSEERIQQLKNNGCRIAAFNVTDSSYFSNNIRYAPSIGLIDSIFMVSGLPITNDCTDFEVWPDFTIKEVPCPFVPENEWKVYSYLLGAKKLHSLPYVTWEPIPDMPWTPWEQRSRKVLLRGGGHSRRIILAMFLMRLGKMDCNSGMNLFMYFAEDMNPAFRFCDACRASYKQNRKAIRVPNNEHCNSAAKQAGGGWDMSNLGFWNNCCPTSFYWMADRFNEKYGGVDMTEFETLLNSRWISDRDHQSMLARIAFTSDLKWIHSIYTPQRFWQGAIAGCINFLPQRTNTQYLFPGLVDGDDYISFSEDFQDLDGALNIDDKKATHIAMNAKQKYDQWIRPGRYPLNVNLLDFIFDNS